MMDAGEFFPPFNACLNALSAVLLLLGYGAIKQHHIAWHKRCMLSALAVSTLFLASYLYFHLVIRHGEPTSFAKRAPSAPDQVKILYLGILLTHTVLAVVVAPLALVTAYLGLRNRLKSHRRMASWTLPIWLYVSITGVVIYWMLYRLYPAP